MSFYAFTTAALQGLSREHWGAKITDNDGNPRDTGVQEFVDELLARLASHDPIQLADTIKLIAPPNGNVVQIINGGDGGGGDGGGGDGETGASGSIQVLTGVTVASVDTSGLTVDTSGMSVNTSGMGINISVSTCTVTATLTGSATLSGGATISGTIIITLALTYTTLNFTSGLFVGSS